MMEGVTNIGGVTRGALPWWFLRRATIPKSLIVVPEESDEQGLVDDLNALFKLPEAWSPPPAFPVRAFASDDEPARLAAFYDWLYGKTKVLVCSAPGLMLRQDGPEALRARSLKLKPGQIIGRRALEDALANGGYVRNDRAEQVGEYAIRGDVVDIWPATEPLPVRSTWNLDTVDALRPIDLHSQRSEGFLRDIRLVPVKAADDKSLLESIPRDAELVIFSLDGSSGITIADGSQRPVAIVGPFEAESNEGFSAPPSYAGRMEPLRRQLIDWHRDDWRVAIFCHNRGERDRLEELLCDPAVTGQSGRPDWVPPLIIGELEHGFLHVDHRSAVLANSEIFGRYRRRIRLPRFDGGESLSSAMDIKPSDYLVHEKHGIGRYAGMRTLKVGKVSSEFLMLEYKGGDKLYVPIFEIQQVQRYLGAEGKRPALSSLDSPAWERIKAKVKEDVAKMAAELLEKAAKRVLRPGYAFPPNSHLEEEFAASFVYPLTRDQKKTLEEVEADMTSSKAMDRLICGDVGYGKTEIAMRAALKSALAGKQVCLLCPTTILAEQHARNFTERLADYPVTVRFLSRFQSPQEQKQIVSHLASGAVDIIIGTHRLLSKDIAFKNLGLLIIDEEHRFGVRQKQRLYALRETVDVLSLTATPIPRTLASALGGIKDLSIIETAPEGRLPISTHVGLFDEDVMVKAVQNELDREGQVFYVHNRVKTLLARKEWLESVLPGIRIGMAHGQMNEHQLETAMHNFLNRKIDVLLSTTIIESGLDIPSVNTLVVEEAEEMGLAQLYQLRGRVGRSATRAYCYLFYSSRNMTSDAKKRLDALREYTSLGSGFRLAMRDMEIRGAGNLLGPQQHGNIAAVGVETYGRLLNEEIQRLRGEPSEISADGPLLELTLSAYLPEDYMPSEMERIHTYKRILAVSKEELSRLKEELVDRCGPLPSPTQTLFDAAFLRLICRSHGISEVHQDPDGVLLYFRPGFEMPEASLKILLSRPAGELTFIPGPPMGIRMALRPEENGLDVLGRFLRLAFPETARTPVSKHA